MLQNFSTRKIADTNAVLRKITIPIETLLCPPPWSKNGGTAQDKLASEHRDFTLAKRAASKSTA